MSATPQNSPKTAILSGASICVSGHALSMDGSKTETMPNLVGVTSNAAGAINAPVGIVTMGRLIAVMKAILGALPMKKTEKGLSLQDVVMTANFNGASVKPRASKAGMIDSIVEAVSPRTELKIWPRSLDWATFKEWAAEGVFGKIPGQVVKVIDLNDQSIEKEEQAGALAAFIKNGGIVDPDSYDEVVGISADLQIKNTRTNKIIEEDYVTSSHKAGRRNPISRNVTGSTRRLVCGKNLGHYVYGLDAVCFMGKTSVPSALPRGVGFGCCEQCGGEMYPQPRDTVRKQNLRLYLPSMADGEPLRKDRYKVQILGRSGAALRYTAAGHTHYNGGRLERILFNVYHPEYGSLTVIGWAFIAGSIRGTVDPLAYDEKMTRAILNTLRHGRKEAEGATKVHLNALARLMAED